MFKKKKETVQLVEGITPEISKPKKKKKFKKRYIAIGIVVILVALIAVNAINAKNVLPVVTVSQALKGDLKSELSTSGLISSEEEKTYYAEVTAPVSVLHIEKGDTVKTGDVLVEFNTTDLENQYEQTALQ